MQGQCTKVWFANVGVNVQHHSGWLAFLQHCHVLKQPQRATMQSKRSKYGQGSRSPPSLPRVIKQLKRSRVRCITLGTMSQQYIVQEFTEVAARKMAELSSLGEVLQSLECPTTWQDWHECLCSATNMPLLCHSAATVIYVISMLQLQQ